jgi:hypothetical protein
MLPARFESTFSFAARQFLALSLAWTLVLPASPAAEGPHAAPVRSDYSASLSDGSNGTAANSQPPAAAAPQASGPLKCAGVEPNDPHPHKALLPLKQNPPIPSEAETEAEDQWGSITVAQPKIWQFERVSSLLDGLLRDVEGISLTDLTQLDPNAQNAAAVKFVQSALEVGVQYDQAAAVTNGINRQNFQLQSAAAQQRFQADNAYLDLLVQQRNAETAQLLAAQNTVNTLQPLADAQTITPAQQEQLTAANSSVATLTKSLGTINTSIGQASLSSLTAAPTLQNTTVGAPASGAVSTPSFSGFADVLKNLPQGVQNNLSTSLQTPTLPAAKRLDNFITLLYERLAREVSVLQDDLSRSPDNVAYLLQFDVGVYPSRKAKNHSARVEFTINCPDCKVYSLYPGVSSYNLANYTGASKRTTIWGNLLTLLGFGASAAYRRQQDTLQGSLVQSAYTAGFQEGVGGKPAQKEGGEPGEEDDTKMPDGSSALQRFGWYYGAAPFQDSVSPGIRTTFAVVTVPRADIDEVRDIFGNSNACMPFHIESAWAKRDDPMRQRESESPIGKVARGLESPFYNWTETDLTKPNGSEESSDSTVAEIVSSRHKRRTSVRLPGAPEEASLVAKRERDILHVVRMEYNTVFADPAPDPATPILAAPSPANATTPPGSSANTTSTSTPSGTTVTTTMTGSAVYDPLAPCQPKACAGVLLHLDRPVDPNLVITVRGEPLKRVRDWRGRATSVLPPAQSGSDLATQSATGNGGIGSTNHLSLGRSLLETDQAEPNSWFALNSNEIFLNISKDVATDDEFPVMQLTDSSHSVIIPHDLRSGTTDLIINGLHMQIETRDKLQRDFLRTYGSDEAVSLITDATRNSPLDKAPITAGPYPFSTYVPLFLPDAPPRRIYARLGETRDDLMIGFLPLQPGDSGSEKPRKAQWKEGQVQVILEDNTLDYAWSLSCYVQGDELACHLPRASIGQVYAALASVCSTDRFCPGAKGSAASVQRSVSASFPNQRWSLAEVADLRARTATAKLFSENLPRAYIQTLQVWVVQFDADDDQVFYSAEPARLNLFPLADGYWTSPFKAWQYSFAAPDAITALGCNYFNHPEEQHRVTLLGSLFSGDSANPRDLSRVGQGPCHTFSIPTKALLRPQLVFRLDWENPSQYPDAMALATYKIAPRFSYPEVEPSFAKIYTTSTKQVQPDGWTVEFNVSRMLCSDTLDIASELLKPGAIKVEWLAGSKPLSTCTGPEPQKAKPKETAAQKKKRLQDDADAAEAWRKAVDAWPPVDNCPPAETDGNVNPDAAAALKKAVCAWTMADKSESVRLRLTIPIGTYPNLSDDIHLVRHSPTYGDVQVATLPNLRELLFPTRLALEPLSPTQFVLRGENAETISAVALQNGTTSKVVQVASGTGFALVTLTAPKDTGGGSTPSDTTGAGNSSNSTDISKDKNGLRVKVTENVTTPKATPKTPPKQTPPATDNSLAPGTYTVIALVKTKEVTTVVKAAAATPATNAGQGHQSGAAGGPTTGQPEPAKPAQSGANPSAGSASPTNGSADKPKSAPKTTTTKTVEYMPVTVTNASGKPLMFTVPAAPKTTAPATPPATTCAVPCVVQGCVATCPAPAASKPATTSP